MKAEIIPQRVLDDVDMFQKATSLGLIVFQHKYRSSGRSLTRRLLLNTEDITHEEISNPTRSGESPRTEICKSDGIF